MFGLAKNLRGSNKPIQYTYCLKSVKPQIFDFRIHFIKAVIWPHLPAIVVEDKSDTRLGNAGPYQTYEGIPYHCNLLNLYGHKTTLSTLKKK